MGFLRKRPDNLISKHGPETDPVRWLKQSLGLDFINYDEKEDKERLLVGQAYGFGSAVDVSNDGTMLIVGAPQGDLAHGSVGGVDAGFIRIYTIATSTVAYQRIGFNAGDTLGSSVGMLSATAAVAGAPGYSSGAGMLYLFETDGTTWTFKDMVIGLGGLGANVDVADGVGYFVTGMPKSESTVSVLFEIASSKFSVLDYVSYPGNAVGISTDGTYVVSSNSTGFMLSFCNTTCAEAGDYALSGSAIGVENNGDDVYVADSDGVWYFGATDTNATNLTAGTSGEAAEDCSLDGFGSSFSMTLDTDYDYPLINIGASTKYAGKGGVITYSLNTTGGATIVGSEMLGANCDENIGRSVAMTAGAAVTAAGGFGVVRLFADGEASGAITVDTF